MSTLNLAQRQLETQARAQPDVWALSDDHDRLTFSELLVAVKSRSAVLLNAWGTPPAWTFVPLLVDKSVESMVSVFACMAARIPFALIDPKVPPARFRIQWEMLGRPHIAVASPRATITPGFPGLTTLRPSIDTDVTEWASLPSAAGDPALVLLTSGSTGAPKGVVWSFSTSDARLEIGRTRLAGREGEVRIPVLSPLHFVAGLNSAVLCLFGASVRLVDPSAVTPKQLLATLTEHRPTQFAVTPHLARVLSAVVESHRAKLPDLRQISTGADTARFEDFRGLRQAVPASTKLVNLLGASEATQSFRYEVLLHDAPEAGQIPLGSLDSPALTRLVPVDDVRYELWRTGPIILCYLRDDQLNARHFHTDEEGVRWWKSGDIVRKSADDLWMFDSRIDDTVKIRGMLASPSESEAVLNTHPDVVLAVVLADEGTSRTRFVAHIQRRPQSSVTPHHLREFLAYHLADHLIPQKFVLHDVLPTTNRDKVDRRTLRDYSEGGVHPSVRSE